MPFCLYCSWLYAQRLVFYPEYILTVARVGVWGGGGDATPMSFSGMAAELLGGSRGNFAQLMGHPLRNFWQKIDPVRSGHGVMKS